MKRLAAPTHGFPARMESESAMHIRSISWRTAGSSGRTSTVATRCWTRKSIRRLAGGRRGARFVPAPASYRPPSCA